VLRLACLVLLLSSACGLRQARLERATERVSGQRADPRCGPVGLRRAALGSRWGESLRVHVKTTTPLSGEARVHVGARPSPLKAFSVTKDEVVFEASWPNEKLSVPSGLEKGVVLDVTLTGLSTPSGDCEGIEFTVEQGAFHPSVDEAAWVAELVRRGGPDVDAWRAQQTPKPSPRVTVAAAAPRPPPMPRAPLRVTPVVAARGSDEREWARWVGEEATGADALRWAEWPMANIIKNAGEGSALGRGAWVVLTSRGDDVRANTEAAAAHYQVPPPRTARELEQLLTIIRSEVETDDAAMLALFAGREVTFAALARAGASAHLDALAAALPRQKARAAEATSQALMFSTAFSLSWPVAATTRVSSPFGYRDHPTLGGVRLHTGVDLPLPRGTEVRATASGLVVRAGQDPVNGRYLVIDHGFGVTTAYLHNTEVLVSEGQWVAAGALVSSSGNTGRSTGPHLHYQLELEHRPVDPLLFRTTRDTRSELVATNHPPH